MSREYTQNMLKLLQEKQKIREEKEAYEEAFNKLSNEEQIIIRKVEEELNAVDCRDRINKYNLQIEREKEEENQREKKEIKRLTKLIEKDRFATVETYSEFLKYYMTRTKEEFPELSTRERLDKGAKEWVKRKAEKESLTQKPQSRSIDTVRNDRIQIISTATSAVCVLAYVGLTIITR